MKTPVGVLTVQSGPRGLERISFGGGIPEGLPERAADQDLTCIQLDEYFRGVRQRFDLPLALEGSDFQLRVWRELLEIPFGQTRSYGQIARAIGQPGAARAVGMANHANPLPIVVPCHRVIGHDGSLSGYGGGIQIKARLLKFEGAFPAQEFYAAGIDPRGGRTPTRPPALP